VTPVTNLLPVLWIPNLSPVSMTPAIPVSKFAAGEVYTSWLWWCTLTCKYLRESLKKFKMTLLLCSGAWGKMIKKPEPKNLGTPSLQMKYHGSAWKLGVSQRPPQPFSIKSFWTRYLKTTWTVFPSHQVFASCEARSIFHCLPTILRILGCWAENGMPVFLTTSWRTSNWVMPHPKNYAISYLDGQ
jgi:hypothetical protein